MECQSRATKQIAINRIFEMLALNNLCLCNRTWITMKRKLQVGGDLLLMNHTREPGVRGVIYGQVSGKEIPLTVQTIGWCKMRIKHSKMCLELIAADRKWNFVLRACFAASSLRCSLDLVNIFSDDVKPVAERLWKFYFLDEVSADLLNFFLSKKHFCITCYRNFEFIAGWKCVSEKKMS